MESVHELPSVATASVVCTVHQSLEAVGSSKVYPELPPSSMERIVTREELSVNVICPEWQPTYI